MKYFPLLIVALLLAGSVSAERICVQKKPKVTKAGRINMVNAIKFTTEACTERQFELSIPEEPVKTALPSNQTITGFYALGGYADAASRVFRDQIDFVYPLAEAPSVEVIASGGSATTNCPGSATSPQAAPGFLCVYEGNNGSSLLNPGSTNQNLQVRNFAQIFVVGTNAATRFGAEIRAQSVDAGSVLSSGVWAVTAP
jgi:hypothetical protein